MTVLCIAVFCFVEKEEIWDKKLLETTYDRQLLLSFFYGVIAVGSMWLVNINCTDSEALQISLGTTFTISALFVEFTKNKFLQYGIVLLFCFFLV